MSVFSTTEIIHAATSTVRLIEDEMIPNSILGGALDSIFTKRPMAQSIKESLLSGPVATFERMYRYGASDDYFYGLPTDKIWDSNQGEEEVVAAIESEIGQTIAIQYFRFTPRNHDHLAWEDITNNQGYSAETNELTVLSASKGFPVYLDRFIPTYYIDPVDTSFIPEAGTREPFTSPTSPSSYSGYSPATHPANDSTNPTNAGAIVLDAQWREGAEELNGVEVHYSWIDAEGDVQTEFYFIVFQYYNKYRDYFQAKYTYDLAGETITGYWTYLIGEGTHGGGALVGQVIHPDVDNVFIDPYVNPGTYFPFIVLRVAGQDRSTLDNTSAEYRSTDKMLGYLGSSFTSIAESLNANPDIGNVDQAIIMTAVPISSQNPVDVEYLFRFFSNLHAKAPVRPPDSISNITYGLQGGTNAPFTLEFQDADFKMNLTMSRITKRVLGGTIGPVGTYVNLYQQEAVYSYIPNQPQTVSGTSGPPEAPIKIRIFRKQITPGLYEEIKINNLKMVFDTFEETSTVAEAGSPTLLVPVDRELAAQFSYSRREVLYTRSLRIVFNSHVIEEIEWYETSLAQFLFKAAAIVIAAVTGRVEALVAAFASVGAFIYYVIQLILTKIILKAVVKIIGVEAALIVSIILISYGAFESFSAGGSPDFGANLISVASGLAAEVVTTVKLDLEVLLEDFGAMELLQQEKMEDLEIANGLLESKNLIESYDLIALKPLIIAGEESEMLFTRTIDSGNIGALAFDVLDNFHDSNLELTVANETLRGLYV